MPPTERPWPSCGSPSAGGSAALLGHPRFEGWAAPSGPVVPGSASAAVDWQAVRARFLVPPGVSVLNAANLCPSPGHVLEAVRALSRSQPVELMPTLLCAHAIPPEWREDRAGYLRLCRDQLVPRVADESRLPKDSKAQCEQVRAVAPERLLQRVGAVPRQRMADIDVALRRHLAL